MKQDELRLFSVSSIIFNLSQKVSMKRISPYFITLAILIIVLTVSCSGLKGAALSRAVSAAEINLTDHTGQPFQLSSQAGKVVLVFFGFSNCVNECPATLAVIRLALETLGNASKNVAVVMVSTDPANDTPQSMKEFMEKFNPAFLGLLGTPDELTKTWQDYGVVVLDDGETHSSLTYVVDKKGNLRETFSPDTSSDDIAADLKVLLAEN
jgi:protein SCO1/2